MQKMLEQTLSFEKARLSSSFGHTGCELSSRRSLPYHCSVNFQAIKASFTFLVASDDANSKFLCCVTVNVIKKKYCRLKNNWYFEEPHFQYKLFQIKISIYGTFKRCNLKLFPIFIKKFQFYFVILLSVFTKYVSVFII